MLRPPRLLLAVALARAANVTRYPNYNNAYGVAVSEGTSAGGTVEYLGTLASSASSPDSERVK